MSPDTFYSTQPPLRKFPFPPWSRPASARLLSETSETSGSRLRKERSGENKLPLVASLGHFRPFPTLRAFFFFLADCSRVYSAISGSARAIPTPLGLRSGNSGRSLHGMEEPQRVQEVGAAPGPDLPRDPDPEETIQSLRVQLATALAEVETVRAVAAVSENTKQEAVEAVRRQCQEEVASLQAILKDTISSYEARLSALERDSRENVWSRLLLRSSPSDSLERQMEKAQEDTERLRAIVLPMEQEIDELKGKLARAEGLVQELQSEQASLFSSSESLLADPGPPDRPGHDHSTLEEGGGVAEKFASTLDSVSIASSSLLVPSPGPPIRHRRSPSPETVSIASSSGTLVPETIYLPPAGYQLVPDSEWMQLHNKVRQQREAVERASREKTNLEEVLKRNSDDCQKQVQVLYAQVKTSEELLRGLQTSVSKSQQQTQEQLADLAASHKRLSYEVQRLSSENEGLRRASSRDSDGRLQRSASPIQDLQSMVNQQRLEAESQLRCAEHQAERLRIEIVSLREKLDEEMAAISSLKGELEREREEKELLQASFNSIQSEMERLQQRQEEGNGSQAQPDDSSKKEASSIQDGNEP